MLPFDGPSGGFNAGHRLRPSSSSSHSSSAASHSHSSRSHLLSHHKDKPSSSAKKFVQKFFGSNHSSTNIHSNSSSHNNTKSSLSMICTRNRVLGSVVLLCICLLIFNYNSIFSTAWTNNNPNNGGASNPIVNLQKEIRNGEQQPVQLNEVPTSVDTTLSTELTQSRTDLEQFRQANSKLKLDLEIANQKLEQAKRQVADAEAAAKEAKEAATTAATPAPVTSDSSALVLSPSSGPIEVPSYPPIAISSSKKYSKFFCIGGRGRLGAQNDRACRFQNLCYKPSVNQWQFYQDPLEKLVVLLDQGRIIEEFPQEFLNARSMGNPTDAQWWSPSIVQTSDGIPASAFVPRSNPDKPTVNVLYHPHYPSNMGHVIGDDLFPIFNLMSSFGMLVRDAQLIITRDCSKIFANNPKKAEQCDFFLKMLIPGLSSREYLAATAPDFTSKLRGGTSGDDDLVCFEQLLIGNGPWGFQQSLGKAPAWWSYHAFYLSNLGINPNRTPKKHRITVSIKKGKRALANNDQLVSYLKEKFPTYEIDALELRTLGGWKKELNYLLDTSILITPCGGVSMSAMFMPHNSAMIIVDYFNLKKNVSFGMEERLWTNLGYVRPFHYPFTIDEVEMPEGHSKTEYQDMRDWGQVRVDMERMETIVKSAISHVDNFMVFGQE